MLLERFLAREGALGTHLSQRFKIWEQNKERMLQGYHTPLALGGQVIEIDTTTPQSFDYADLSNMFALLF